MQVSSRGNFYLTWTPGQDFWIPHGRDSPKRIQGMGFVRDDINEGLWMSLRGGDLVFSESKPDVLSADLKFKKVNLKSGGESECGVGPRILYFLFCSIVVCSV